MKAFCIYFTVCLCSLYAIEVRANPPWVHPEWYNDAKSIFKSGGNYDRAVSELSDFLSANEETLKLYPEIDSSIRFAIGWWNTQKKDDAENTFTAGAPEHHDDIYYVFHHPYHDHSPEFKDLP